MPKGPNGQKRPGDVIGAAIMVPRIATGEVEDNAKRAVTSTSARRAGGDPLDDGRYCGEDRSADSQACEAGALQEARSPLGSRRGYFRPDDGRRKPRLLGFGGVRLGFWSDQVRTPL